MFSFVSHNILVMTGFFSVLWEEFIRQLSPVGKNISEEITHLLNYEPKFYLDLGFTKSV